jgi:GMP reductase
MRIIEDVKLDYKDVLICPKRSTLRSRKDTDIVREFKFKHCKRILKSFPIVAANMDGVGTFAMARAFFPYKMMVALHKYYSIDELKKFFEEIGEKNAQYVFYTTGIADEDFEKLVQFSKKVKKGLLQNICIDVANGYTERFADYVKKVREKFPEALVMAGNVVTGEMVEQLILSGADIIKIGIGPGSACLTRRMTGVGYPQLSAVIECADAAHGMGGRICADGGCEYVGDVVKAIAGGADFVMSGSMFTGHDESDQEIIEKNGKQYMKYFGSSSDEAMKRHYGGTKKYKTSEGREIEVLYRGAVEGRIQELEGGLRSACTYVGAAKLKELTKKTTFIKVNRQLNQLWEK